MKPEDQPSPPQQVSPDKRIDILNDHCKDTFARIREQEQSRDLLFLWAIAAYTLLTLEIGYPAALGGALGKVSVPGVGDLNLQALPLPAILNATWLVLLVLILQYCQSVVRVER